MHWLLQKKNRIGRTLSLTTAFLATLATSCHADGFDCAKAEKPVEKLICAHENLRQYDNIMSDLYKRDMQSSNSEDLPKSQRHWLRQRNECSSAECITAKYDERLYYFITEREPFINPPEDSRADLNPSAWAMIFPANNVTCEKMHQIPRTVFGLGTPDLGSGHGSPIDVDYQCQGGLASLKFMDRLLKLAEEILSENGPQWCTGSIVYAHWRYYQYSLLQAGLSPSTLISNSSNSVNSPSGLWSYFDAWGAESPSNYRLQREFLKHYNDVMPTLAHYYQGQYGLQESESKKVAKMALMFIAQRATGSFPGSSEYSDQPAMQLSPLAEQLKSDSVNIGAISMLIQGGASQSDLYQALKIALARKSSPKVIDLLLARIERIDQGDESALFFALNDKDNFDRLIKKGASINYQNGFGKTPLFYAIESGDHTLVERLLNIGADPNHPYMSATELKKNECTYNITHSRRTPLMHAAQHSDPKMLKLLIRHGAKLEVKDDVGFNASDFASKFGTRENVELLKSLGLSNSSIKN